MAGGHAWQRGHAWQGMGGICGRGACMAGGMHGRGASMAGGECGRGGMCGMHAPSRYYMIWSMTTQ